MNPTSVPRKFGKHCFRKTRFQFILFLDCASLHMFDLNYGMLSIWDYKVCNGLAGFGCNCWKYLMEGMCSCCQVLTSCERNWTKGSSVFACICKRHDTLAMSISRNYQIWGIRFQHYWFGLKTDIWQLWLLCGLPLFLYDYFCWRRIFFSTGRSCRIVGSWFIYKIESWQNIFRWGTFQCFKLIGKKLRSKNSKERSFGIFRVSLSYLECPLLSVFILAGPTCGSVSFPVVMMGELIDSLRSVIVDSYRTVLSKLEMLPSKLMVMWSYFKSDCYTPRSLEFEISRSSTFGSLR